MATAQFPRPMRADARRNYEHIVATAGQLFLEQGIDVPLDEVAKRAEVGPGTLYRHFPTRDALIEAVYRGEIEELAGKAYELAEKLPPQEAVFEWMRSQLRFVLNRAGLAFALKSAIDKDSETFSYCKQVLHKAVRAVLEPAQRSGAVRADLEPGDLLRLGHGLGTGARNADDAGAERLLAVVLDGLRAGTMEP